MAHGRADQYRWSHRTLGRRSCRQNRPTKRRKLQLLRPSSRPAHEDRALPHQYPVNLKQRLSQVGSHSQNSCHPGSSQYQSPDRSTSPIRAPDGTRVVHHVEKRRPKQMPSDRWDKVPMLLPRRETDLFERVALAVMTNRRADFLGQAILMGDTGYPYGLCRKTNRAW